MSAKVSHVEVGTGEVVAVHKMVREGVSSGGVIDRDMVVGIVGRLDLFGAIVHASPDD